MKNLKWVLAAHLMLIVCFGYSQSTPQKEQHSITYKILNPGLVGDVSNYISALDKADLSSHRLRNGSNIIKFESGLEVEIFSAQHLSELSLLSNDINFYLENFGSSERPIFRLADNDFIIELHTIQEKK